jgi:hypothetical protein
MDPYLTLAITATSAGLAELAPSFLVRGSIYLSSQTSSMRQLLKTLLTMIVRPLT